MPFGPYTFFMDRVLEVASRRYPFSPARICLIAPK
jgi:hypothetical protein